MIFLLSSAIGLTSEAQVNYTLLERGQPMPYKGVAVELQTYRKESEFIKLSDSLINSLKRQIVSLDAIILANNKIIQQQEQAIQMQAQLLKSKEETAQELSQGLQDIKEAMPKQRWFENPFLLSGVGFVAAILLMK